MKKLLSITGIVFGVLLFSINQAQAQADFKVGAGLAYGTEAEAIGLQGNAVLGFGSVRGAADFTYFFPDGFDWYGFNVNGHYMLVSKVNVAVYGLAGLNYTTISVDLGQFGTASNSELGLNLGGGAEFGLGVASLFSELKYVIGDADQLVLAAGLRFGL